MMIGETMELRISLMDDFRNLVYVKRPYGRLCVSKTVFCVSITQLARLETRIYWVQVWRLEPAC